jgi:hypothetical protein
MNVEASALMMQAAESSETSVYFYQTTQHYALSDIFEGRPSLFAHILNAQINCMLKIQFEIPSQVVLVSQNFQLNLW